MARRDPKPDAGTPIEEPPAHEETHPAEEPRRPIQEFRLGRIKADGEAAWRTSTALNRNDLPLVAKVTNLAHTFIFRLVQNDTPF